MIPITDTRRSAAQLYYSQACSGARESIKRRSIVLASALVAVSHAAMSQERQDAEPTPAPQLTGLEAQAANAIDGTQKLAQEIVDSYLEQLGIDYPQLENPE